MTKLLINVVIVIASLLLFTLVSVILKRMPLSERWAEIAALWDSRVRSWWGMAAVFSLAFITGGVGSMLVFCIISFMLLRELITVTPTRIEKI